MWFKCYLGVGRDNFVILSNTSILEELNFFIIFISKLMFNIFIKENVNI